MKSNWKHTLAIWYFGLTKIPMIFFTRPRVHILDDDICQIMIPLKRRSKNHLKRMYIGNLVVGADLAAGLFALKIIKEQDQKISLIFKDMKAIFYKGVDADALFSCRQADVIRSLVQKVIATGERHHETVSIEVTAPELYGDEIMAEFSLTLSLKVK